MEVNDCDEESVDFSAEIEELRRLFIKPVKKEITIDLKGLDSSGYRVPQRETTVHTPTFIPEVSQRQVPIVTPVAGNTVKRQVNYVPRVVFSGSNVSKEEVRV